MLSMMKLHFLLVALCCIVAAAEAKRETKCIKQQKESEVQGVPACTAAGKFEKKQCDDDKCWCVKARSGKPAFKKQQVPLEEDYDCKKKPKTCQKKRFEAMLSGAAQVPVCDDSGDFVTQQCTAGGSNEVNIARDQPTFSPGVTHNGFPSNAVDGDKNPNYFQYSCTHTANLVNPWWAVDLGHSRVVASVHITNRADCCSERLGDLNIFTTDISSDEEVPNFHNYDVCATSEEALGSGETRAFDCGTKGRYLVIQLNRTGPLTLCEVQVFEADKECWCVKPRTGKVISGSLKPGAVQC
jgi:hypothetical protein